ncbi:pentapeptide repeat-containing protein [Phytomonospora sp. NPDC050363]|uniref:pentapeptide repeat-containing protein n=1 Tax=Phytomonospora sp. NPDC050363 TaxID=3155642 RepID=UPI0033ED7702
MWKTLVKALGRTVGALLGIVLIGVTAGAFGPLPGWILGDRAASGLNPNEWATAEAGVRGALLQAVAGALLVLGGLTAWRQMLIARQSHHLSRRTAVTEAFSRAVEQLGTAGESTAVRLGGVYALDRIAEDDPRERGRIAEILAAFIREHGAAGQVPRDVSAAVTVLCGRDWPSGADLAGIGLAGRRLAGARLRSAALAGADLSGADLRRADLSGADLSGADLRRAQLARADLSGAELAGALLSGAVGDARTRWPEGFAPADHGVLPEA